MRFQTGAGFEGGADLAVDVPIAVEVEMDLVGESTRLAIFESAKVSLMGLLGWDWEMNRGGLVRLLKDETASKSLLLLAVEFALSAWLDVFEMMA